jgi:hypothetical protein
MSAANQARNRRGAEAEEQADLLDLLRAMMHKAPEAVDKDWEEEQRSPNQISGWLKKQGRGKARRAITPGAIKNASVYRILEDATAK